MDEILKSNDHHKFSSKSKNCSDMTFVIFIGNLKKIPTNENGFSNWSFRREYFWSF
jgi:hypothetical protein